MTTQQRPYLHSVDIGVLRFNQASEVIEVMLQKRLDPDQPYFGQWALPGIVINGDMIDQDINAALARLLASPKVGIPVKYTEQVGTEGNGVRDPRCWSSTTVYLGLVDDAISLEGDKQWVPLAGVLSSEILLAFDHNLLAGMIYERLASKCLYSSLGLQLLPQEFTITGAISVFSSILNYPVARTSMVQRITKLTDAGLVLKTDRKNQPLMGRAQTIYENLQPEKVFFFDRTLSASE
ncbi:NUDIX hydrolase (plasmid) [Pseudomonas silesiensis]|uniref:NUDIX hydrolase n=1 Tax=Pseudomonas silesiensis TaxID=1853130 RepID=UPI0030D376DC